MNNKEKIIQLNKALVYIMPKNLPEVVKLFLENGADANSKDYEYTALMLAAGNRNIENDDVVEMLLQSGANINEKNRDGWTALMLAVRNGNEKCAQVLIDNNADIDIPKKDGYTALMLATISGRYNLIKSLLAVGADISLKSNRDGTALDMALMTEHSMTMGKEKNELVIQLLLNHGATVPLPNEEGVTFLMKMIYKGFVDVAEYLLTTGVDTKETDKTGRTAATFAEFKGLSALAQRLNALA